MRKIPTEKLAVYGVSVLIIVALAAIFSRLPRTRGKNILFHVLYSLGAILSIVFLPSYIQDEIFSPGTNIMYSCFLHSWLFLLVTHPSAPFSILV
jgi:hypothetical protein